MKRALFISLTVFALWSAVLGQWGGGWNSYPGGYLLMSYRFISGERTFEYTLELSPKGDDTYAVRTEIVGDASIGELGDALFFAWNPLTWLPEAWWLPYYFMILNYGPPQPGRTYVLPGGLSLVTEDTVEIAGVKAVKGVLSMPDDPNTRIIIAISPDPAVPYPVLIRQERKSDGAWEREYEIVLVDYEHRE